MTGTPERIGRYTVAKELGSGGMGEVYLAYTPGGQPVAVKLIRSDKLDPVTRARFEKEALIARTVIGTNRVARFLEADPFADRPWLAMEYVAGRTLLACVDQDGVLPLPLVASLGALLAEGLSAVHAAELLHRDLKPQNVIMGTEGPIIIDFGLGAFMDAAKESLSHSGMIIGTVRCMPPEQASGHPKVTPAADVYALGTVLLYAAARHYPYDGAVWEAVAMQVANPDIGPDLSGVPEGLKQLIACMLAHVPEDRPTLDDVSKACSKLLKAAGKAPADARLALIAHTASGGTPDAAKEPLSPSFEKLLEDQAEITDDAGLDSPLDSPRGAAEAEEPEPEEVAQYEPHPDAAEKAVKPKAEPKARPKAVRPPASKRVADELRAEYAADTAL
ncbi:serine/threonine protein kinase [Streptomyces sp. J2-1]|uniref:serine/threonine-protein kinase n=1 Tax=Streptomyces corallincola TaxID=2851888 RepID=UPI001C37FE17|nr:serine/threonine-protein kinase [Streptomyces corallincola]MBV2354182.1 serine/threonine protein kinase [Streptomyces corallincola]